ncbi:MAG: HhH-GDP family DNA glycosylase [Planctomycetota bacterium]|jgi:thermostable 8-oxoguanine DNA glycosylase
MTIQPLEVTNYTRSIDELERFWIFCIMVAGKNSDYAAKKVGDLLTDIPKAYTPLEYLRLHQTILHNLLVVNKTGQYGRIKDAIEDSFDLDLRTCSVEELQEVRGVGPKTARFFILHSREDAKVAVLDTHVLKWLREHGVENAPQHTPLKSAYEKFERIALCLIEAYYPGLTVAQADLLIWATMSGRLGSAIPS